MTQGRRSAFEILRAMPEAFDLSTFSRMADLERGIAKTYLSRWSKAGHVLAAGPRVGVYYNLVRAPDSPSSRSVDALRMVYPSAVLCGASVLHAAGWTTQIPSSLTVAVTSRDSVAAMDGFEIALRPRTWYAAMHADLFAEKDFSTYGLRSLSPAAALADLYARPGQWHPDPDDLDVEPGTWGEVRDAFLALRAREPDWLADAVESSRAPGPR